MIYFLGTVTLLVLLGIAVNLVVCLRKEIENEKED